MQLTRRTLILLGVGLISGAQAPGALIHPARVPTPICVKFFAVPRYPALARQANVQGEVTATVHLRSDGSVESVSDPQGPSLLQDSTVKALGSWRFEVTQEDKRTLTVTFRYTLKGPPDRRLLVHEVSGLLPDHIEIVSNAFPTEPFPAKESEDKPD